MKIVVAGAGAVGSHYGSLLSQGGGQVHLLARGAHLAALRRHGLMHVRDTVERTLHLSAGDDPAAAAGADVVLFACKMPDLDALAASLAPHLPESALAVTMQNGVRAPEIVAARLPGHAVAAASVFIGVHMKRPGVVVHTAAGHVRLGVWREGAGEEMLARLVAALDAVGVGVEKVDDVARTLWTKMLWNCGFNAATALARVYARELLAAEDSGRLVHDLMFEALAAARAEGVALTEADVRRQIEATLKIGRVKTSMWQDLERGRPTEIDDMNGHVVRLAEAHGLDAPASRMLTALVRAAERGYECGGKG